MTDQTTNQTNADDDALVWGVESIAKIIGRTPRATFHILEKHELPGAKRIGGRWAFRPAVFKNHFEQQGVAA